MSRKQDQGKRRCPQVKLSLQTGSGVREELVTCHLIRKGDRGSRGNSQGKGRKISRSSLERFSEERIFWIQNTRERHSLGTAEWLPQGLNQLNQQFYKSQIYIRRKDQRIVDGIHRFSSDPRQYPLAPEIKCLGNEWIRERVEKITHNPSCCNLGTHLRNVPMSLCNNLTREGMLIIPFYIQGN